MFDTTGKLTILFIGSRSKVELTVDQLIFDFDLIKKWIYIMDWT